MTETLTIRTDITPSLHPEGCAGDGPGARACRSALAGMYRAQGTIIDLSKDKRLNQGQVAASATPYAQKATQRADTVIQSLGEQVAHLDSRINQELRAGKTANDAELRGYWLAQGSKAFIGMGKLFQKPADNLSTVAAVTQHFLGLLFGRRLFVARLVTCVVACVVVVGH